MLEAAEAVLGPRTLEAVTNNLTSLSSSRSRDNLMVRPCNSNIVKLRSRSKSVEVQVKVIYWSGVWIMD